MKNIKQLVLLVLAVLFITSCSKVPAGNVGIQFHLLGGSKGVDYDELTPGRYWIGMNEELFLFPTYTQNYVWTHSEDEGSENDESLNFQDVDGLELNADIGITYKIIPDKVPLIFEKYKRGVEEITDTYLRNMVRDALVKTSSTQKVDYIYGIGKAQVIQDVQKMVEKQVAPIGIDIEKIYWIGRIKLPKAVKESIDMKIKATQLAQQKENELRQTEADKQKRIVKAEGVAESILLVAKAQAQANKLLNSSITNTLVEYERVKKWNGVKPQVVGGNTLVDLR